MNEEIILVITSACMVGWQMQPDLSSSINAGVAATASGLAFLIQKYPALKWSTTCVAVVAGSDFFASPNVKTAGASLGTGAIPMTTTAVLAQMQMGFEAVLKDSSEVSQSVRDRKVKVANFDLLTKYTSKGENAGQFIYILTKAGNIDHQGLG